jgi:IS5 family transposase
VDRGYRGAKKYVDCEVLLPSPPLKRDTEYQRQKKRILGRKRAAIEPIIGHLKHDYRLSRNWLKGSQGDAINLLMAACAWNLRKWMVAFFCCKNNPLLGFIIVINPNQQDQWVLIGIKEI